MALQVISRIDAQTQGLKRFYTNAPCSHGHLSERFVQGGGCVACIYEKNAAWAKRNPDKKRDCLNRWLVANADHSKAQRKAYHAEWYKANRDKKLAESAVYSKAHPEVARAAVRKWRAANKDAVRAANRAWEQANPDKRSALTKKNYSARPEHYRAKNAKWAKDNPEKKAVVDRRRRAREKGAEGDHTAADIAEILKAQGHCCAYCKASLKRVKRHIDHIKPLSKGGTNDRNNIQVCCESCNLSKGSKDPVTYARSIGLLL